MPDSGRGRLTPSKRKFLRAAAILQLALMRKIQNTNISFRATTDLKQRLTEYCLENDQHNSSVIRQALNSYLRLETKANMPRLIAEQQGVWPQSR
jgi:hypothetical protein